MQLLPEYIKLIRSIGIPSVIEGINSYNEDIEKLARINKVHYLYLTINKISDDNLEERYRNIKNLINEIATIFSHNAIEYVIFKTLKPFPYIPSDIDILIEPVQLSKITTLLNYYNYTTFIKDSLCFTMKKHYINVDLYLEPSVSDIPYLNRELLMKHKIDTKINNITINKLADYAEFVAVMCHAFYKEQMFTLSDYYTLTILAESSNVNDIITLSKENNCLDILNIISNICKKITLEVFERNDLKICKLADILMNDNNLIKPMDIITLPYKFSVKYVTVLLFKKIMKEKGMMNTLRYFTRSMSFKQIKKLVNHIQRETY